MKTISVKRILGIVSGNILITSAYAFITVPNEIINGGITSFSMVLGKLSGVDLSVFVNAITVLLLLLCLIFLGKKFFLGSIFSCVCYLFFFTVFHHLGWGLPFPRLVGLLLAGVLVGTGYSLCIRCESTAVGFDVVALILNRKNPKINVALAMCIINVLVLLSGFLVYGFWAVAEGILFTALQSGTLNILQKIDLRAKTKRSQTPMAAEKHLAESAADNTCTDERAENDPLL